MKHLLSLSCAFVNFQRPLHHHRSRTAALSRAMSTTSSTTKQLVVDPFCFRQFRETEASKTYSGTIFESTIADFETIVNERYTSDAQLQDGYAPFCKHLFLVNDFTSATLNVLPITPDNEHLLRTRYEARNERELPVLARYFPRDSMQDMTLPVAPYLDLILYSREQINKENAAQGSGAVDESTAPWGIVSIKAQDRDSELPMNPITSMRNALGKEEGGSGVPIDRKQYMEAVAYWKDHAILS